MQSVEQEFSTPHLPASFQLTVRLAFTSREPYCSEARLLKPGQPLRLCREPGNPHDCQAIRVETLSGNAVGYLYAETAGYLAVLIDHYGGISDWSRVEEIKLAAPPNDPAARKMRYPQVMMRLCLDLQSAWPLFVIIAVLGIKSDDFASRYNLAGNPWLALLELLHEQYQRVGHDLFCLPDELAKAWIGLTGQVNG